MRAWVGTTGISRRSCLIYAICRDASRDYRSACILPTENRFDSRNSMLSPSVSLFSFFLSCYGATGTRAGQAVDPFLPKSFSSLLSYPRDCLIECRLFSHVENRVLRVYRFFGGPFAIFRYWCYDLELEPSSFPFSLLFSFVFRLFFGLFFVFLDLFSSILPYILDPFVKQTK